jgi:hypothetical protein
MASTDLITYLNYISTWETESDANIDVLITEQRLFANLGNYNSDTAVNSEFDTLLSLACEVRDLTIAADATQMAADAAAVASIWSFGLGMAAYAALEATELIERAVISSKSKDLNAKLDTADTDISSQISPDVNSYVTAYKQNNNLIISKAPKGLDTQTCRSNLMQFMAQVQRKSGKLDAATFRQYAESARIVYSSDEINKVYDALDELNLSAKTDADIKKFMNTLNGFQAPAGATFGKVIVTNVALGLLSYKLKIANAKIKTMAEEQGIAPEEVDTTAFAEMDMWGKFAAGVTVIMSVIDVVLNIIDIVDVVEQCKTMCDKLSGDIKSSYLSYFNSIRDASAKYREAVGLPPSSSVTPVNPPTSGVSAANDIQQMHAQIQQWGSITQFGVRIANITGNADNPNQSSGTATKTDHGFSGYNGSWQIGNWGDTLKFTG